MKLLSKNARIAAFAVGLVTLFALVLQVYVVILDYHVRGESTGAAIWFAYGFFTIWTNTLVALTALYAAFDGMRRSAMARHCTQTAVTVYIVTVFVTYELLLRGIVRLEGMAWWADFLVHDVVPLSWALWWFVFSRKAGLAYALAPLWAMYSIAYLAFALVRGAFTGFYPYPFIDVAKKGYGAVAVSSIMMTLAFLVMSCVFIAIDRALARRKD